MTISPLPHAALAPVPAQATAQAPAQVPARAAAADAAAAAPDAGADTLLAIRPDTLPDTLPDASAQAEAGLLARPAQIAPSFLYDALGARLFDAITELEAYYPTRTEAQIMAQHGAAIVQAVLRITGAAPVLIDLGAGNGAKAERLFGPLAPSRYVAVDVSTAFLATTLPALRRAHPALDIVGVAQDFSQQLALAESLTGNAPALLFYPGSSIGNFSPEAALRLLQQARQQAHGGALLIGVDRVKPAHLLQAAYDDELGVTAAFNLNLLKHLNRLLEANFDVRQWRHVALYNAAAARIEMHLQARQPLTVRWRGGGQRRFDAGERIHTENSYKWTPERFTALLHDAGWHAVQHWSDERQWFSVFVAAARP